MMKRVEKMSLLIEIIKILIGNDIFLTLLVDKEKLKNTCFLLVGKLALNNQFLSSKAANRWLEVAWANLLAFCFAHWRSKALVIKYLIKKINHNRFINK